MAKSEKEKESDRLWRLRNPEKIREYRRRHKGSEADRRYRRAAHLRKKFGLTVEEFEAMKEAQGGVCAICHQECYRELCVDHDHGTGAIRGLLCEKCNLAIGSMSDDPSRLRAAADYLESES